MRQKNPTLSAETQVLDPAHPCEGVGSLGGFETCPNSLKLKLTDSLSQQERLQLSEKVRMDLEAEIGLMKEAIQMLGSATKRVEKGEPINKDLCDAVNALGLACSRAANLMRVQLLIKGPQSEGLLDDLVDALNDFVETMTMEQEEQND